MTNFISGNVDSEQILDALNRLVSQGQDTTPAMRDIASFMENQVRLGFSQSLSPYGEPWAPVERNGKPLIDTRTMLGSVSSLYGPDFAETGLGVEYAAHQHYGDAPGTGITARPMLPIQEDEIVLPDYWETQILGILEEHTFGGLSG